MEIKFAGEVFKQCAGMGRDQANDIANKLLPRYESQLGQPPMGKSFAECYDVQNLEPSHEWQTIYDKVKDEVIRAGMPLQ